MYYKMLLLILKPQNASCIFTAYYLKSKRKNLKFWTWDSSVVHRWRGHWDMCCWHDGAFVLLVNPHYWPRSDWDNVLGSICLSIRLSLCLCAAKGNYPQIWRKGWSLPVWRFCLSVISAYTQIISRMRLISFYPINPKIHCPTSTRPKFWRYNRV